MNRVVHPTVYRGSHSRPRSCVAPADSRYVGLFYWCAYWGHWDKIIAVGPKGWTVQTIDLDGNPKPGEEGRVRTHMTEMDARSFADKPFVVSSR